MTDRNAALVDVSPALVEVLKEVNNLNTDGPSMSGILQKQAFKTLKWRSWKPRWCEIRGNFLIYSATKEDTVPLGVIRLRNAKCTENGSGFCIKSPASYSRKDQYSAREYYFQCNDTNTLGQWMRALLRVNSDSSKNSQAPKRELVSTIQPECILVTNASSYVGLECVKTLLLKKMHVIALCSTHRQANDPKVQLLKKYGATHHAIDLENEQGIIDLVQNTKQKCTGIVAIFEPNLNVERDIRTLMNVAKKFSIQKFIKISFSQCGKRSPTTKLFQAHNRADSALLTEQGISTRVILRLNPIMQDFLDYYYEHTRTLYVPFGKIVGFGDEDTKRIAWIDGRDVAHTISTLLTTNNTSSSLNMLNEGTIVSTLCGRESLTIDEISQLFAKKMNGQPINIVTLAYDQYVRRAIDMYNEYESASELRYEIFDKIYDTGALKHIDLDWCKQLRIAPRTFEEFIERELVSFQGKKQTVCAIGSVPFVQRHLLKLIQKQYRARHVVCSAQDRESDDSATHYLVYDFERQKKLQIRREVVPDRFRFLKSNETVAELDLQQEFLQVTIKEALDGCDYLLLLLSSKYIEHGWLSFDIIKAIINLASTGKTCHLILGYDLATLDSHEPFISKIEAYLKKDCQIPFSKCLWNWTYQSFGMLTGSEIQCRSTLSVPRPKNTEGPSLSWVDAHDVAKGIVSAITKKSTESYFFSGPQCLSLSEMAETIGKSMENVIDVTYVADADAFPNMYTKDRLIEKQKGLCRSFVKFYRTNEDHSKSAVETNYCGDYITSDIENLTGQAPTDFQKFVASSTYMFANLLQIAEHVVPSMNPSLMQSIGSSFRRRKRTDNSTTNEPTINPVFSDLNSCMSVEGQEKIIFEFLMEKSAEPTNQLLHVVTRFARLFTHMYEIRSNVTVQEELENFRMGKNVINAFMERMMDILSTQVFQQIINSPHVKREIVQVAVRDMQGYFYRVIEHLLFNQIHASVLALYKRHYTSINQSLNEKCATELKNCTPMHLEINEQFCLCDKGSSNDKAKNAEANYLPAIDELRKLSTERHAMGKLQILLSTNQKIVECIKTYHGEDIPVGADDLVPIFIYLIIKANIPDLWCHYKFVEDFTHESIMMGNIGYSLATLQASTEHVKTLSWASLEQNYKQLEERKKSQDEFINNKNKEMMLRKMKGISLSINTLPVFTESSPLNSPTNKELVSPFTETLSVEEAVKLSKTLLTEIINIYTASKLDSSRYGWGTLNELSSLIHAISQERMTEFVNMTQDLKRVDLTLFVQPEFSTCLSIFLINLYHVMIYHGIAAHGSFPMLQQQERESFLGIVTQYDVGQFNLTCDDIHCLLTGKAKARNLALEPFYIDAPELHFLLNLCCFSSPPLHVLGVKSDQDWQQMVQNICATYLADSCRLDHDKKQLAVPQQLKSYATQFGETTEDLLHWLIDHLPQESILRKELLTVDVGDAEGCYTVKSEPFSYDFWFKSPIVSVAVNE